MAERRNTDPKVQVELPKNQFNNVIRFLLTVSLDKVLAVRTATYIELKRLGVKRNLDKAVTSIPSGSDQGDIGSLIAWAKRIGPKTESRNKNAIAQLVAIDATCCSRGSK